MICGVGQFVAGTVCRETDCGGMFSSDSNFFSKNIEKNSKSEKRKLRVKRKCM